MDTLEYLRKLTKTHNWDGIIHYGRNGSEQIDIKKVCEDYHQLKLKEK